MSQVGSGDIGEAWASRRLRLRRKNKKRKTMPSTRTPPTTPPMIGPSFTEEPWEPEDGEGEEELEFVVVEKELDVVGVEEVVGVVMSKNEDEFAM